jgi:hypothetical protein
MMRRILSDDEFVVPCIVCKKEFAPMFEGHPSINDPNNGVSFYSSGQYGSQVFDSFQGNMIEINVCDECVKVAIDEEMVIYRHRADDKNLAQGVYLWNGKDWS